MKSIIFMVHPDRFISIITAVGGFASTAISARLYLSPKKLKLGASVFGELVFLIYCFLVHPKSNFYIGISERVPLGVENKIQKNNLL